MKIATFNCNSIRTRLSLILEWLQKNVPEVLFLQETKIQDKDFPINPFKEIGYEIWYVGQKAYNGVATATKGPSELIKKNLNMDKNNEARFLEVNYKTISLMNVYIPQGTSVDSERFQYKLNFFDWLYEYVSSKYTPNDLLIMAGDFNVALTDKDVYAPDEFRGDVCFHPEEQIRLQRFFEWGFVDLYRYKYPEEVGYTFWDYRVPNGFKRNMGWRIDYILATKSLASHLKDVKIAKELRLLPKPSDHTILWAEFDLSM